MNKTAEQIAYETLRTYYHGTKPSLIPKILEEGLDPQYSLEGKEAPAKGKPDWDPYISLTKYPRYAKAYASPEWSQDEQLAFFSKLRKYLSDMRGDPELLQVDLPESFEAEEMISHPGTQIDEHRSYRRIPPEYITRYKEAATKPLTDLDQFKKKLKPGDILLTKPSEGSSNLFSKAISWISGSPWTHSGMYMGDNSVYHMYPKIVGKSKVKGDHAMRTHKMTTLDALGRDIMAVRPKASSRDRKKAVDIMHKNKDVTYSVTDLLRAGFFPKGKEDETENPTQLATAICSGVIAAAYPKLDFRTGKSFLHVRPADFITSKNTKAVGVYQHAQEKKAVSADLVRRAVAKRVLEKGLYRKLTLMEQLVRPGRPPAWIGDEAPRAWARAKASQTPSQLNLSKIAPGRMYWLEEAMGKLKKQRVLAPPP